MSHCFNRKVLIGLAAVAGAVLLFAPGTFAAVLPLMIFAVCPLSMVLMMRTMSRGHGAGESSSHPAARAQGDTDAELARLRAEVEELRAAQAVSQQASPRS